MSDTNPEQTQAPAPAQTAAPAAPAPAPAAPAFDPDQFRSELIAELEEKRIKPLQTLINERDEQIRQLQTASLSEEELEQLANEEQDEYIASLERRTWIAERRGENASVAEMFQKLLDAETPEDQWTLLAELVESRNEAPQAPAPEPESQVPDVDPNNPFAGMGGEDVLKLPDGRVYTDELADSILKGMTHWPTS